MQHDAALVDTDVVSYFVRRKSKPEMQSRAMEFMPLLSGKALYISFASIGELRYGAIASKWMSRSVEALESTIERYIVVPGTSEVAEYFARVKSFFAEQMSELDMWIAATALEHRLPVCTNNLKHFRPMADRFGFEILHPSL